MLRDRLPLSCLPKGGHHREWNRSDDETAQAAEHQLGRYVRETFAQPEEYDVDDAQYRFT